MKKILVTGAAGFIGYHTIKKLLQDSSVNIVGVDNINDYYDVDLKYDRLADCGVSKSNISTEYTQSELYPNYRFKQLDIANYTQLNELFRENEFDCVINLAAQAGVRYSLINPDAYVQSNLVGFANILECCRHFKIKHLLYASSSSVYGMCNDIPFSEDDNVDYPVSFYAATKKSNELMAHSYSHLYQLPTTALRFFTVYGPWGRPDMAPFIFAKSIYEGEAIKIFNQGDMLRDFTYIDDIVEGVVQSASNIPTENEAHPYYRVLNIGNSQPVKLLDFVRLLELTIGKKANLNMLGMQPGDVVATYADTSKLEHLVGYKPSTLLKDGLSKFILWYKQYYQL